ncbi:MAG: hypothetical protein M3534_13490, partial [Actinomycetota bacterium]|nr:hypothetical protein [Actinomycetota bacterium]
PPSTSAAPPNAPKKPKRSAAVSSAARKSKRFAFRESRHQVSGIRKIHEEPDAPRETIPSDQNLSDPQNAARRRQAPVQNLIAET